MNGLQRLRKLERVVQQMEADAQAAGYRLNGEVEVAEEVIVYEIAAAACIHFAQTGPAAGLGEYTREVTPLQTVHEAAADVLAKLKALQVLTGETGQPWQARVERILSSDKGLRLGPQVLMRVEEVRAVVLGMISL